VFHVEKEYKNLSDLDKIDALNDLQSEDCSSDDQSSDADDEETGKVYYTCQKKKCRIPCPCAPCCTQEKQCPEHKVKHLQNWFKLFAKDRNDLHKREKKERHYYRSVCPHCDKQFCEPASAKKHIELEHNQSPFMWAKMGHKVKKLWRFGYCSVVLPVLNIDPKCYTFLES
jgi:hypothetical protein